ERRLERHVSRPSEVGPSTLLGVVQIRRATTKSQSLIVRSVLGGVRKAGLPAPGGRRRGLMFTDRPLQAALPRSQSV
ncbi:MAG: hypothetical protein AVDCRST_MAG93-931, partial [uncultured Chloroflexia bacterium]